MRIGDDGQWTDNIQTVIWTSRADMGQLIRGVKFGTTNHEKLVQFQPQLELHFDLGWIEQQLNKTWLVSDTCMDSFGQWSG